MAKRNKRRKSASLRVRREERAGPTLETLRHIVKAGPDWLLDLPADHQRAVERIRKAHELVTGHIGYGMNNYLRQARGYDNLDTEADREIWRDYMDWCDALKPSGHNWWRVLVVGHRDCERYEVKWQWGSIVAALKTYCDIWLKGRAVAKGVRKAA